LNKSMGIAISDPDVVAELDARFEPARDAA
jgi:hypothetical protein